LAPVALAPVACVFWGFCTQSYVDFYPCPMFILGVQKHVSVIVNSGVFFKAVFFKFPDTIDQLAWGAEWFGINPFPLCPKDPF
jgi:hypothetical protein